MKKLTNEDENVEDALEDALMDRMADEYVAMRQEILAKEMLMACMVVKAGGTVTISKADLKDLAFMVGDVFTLVKNGGQCLNREKTEDSVTFTLKLVKSEGQVM